MIRADKLKDYLIRNKGERKPIMADVFLTDVCNNRCKHCMYDHGSAARSMTLDEFKTYATRLRELGVQGIFLTGGGEPTCNPDFDSICAWLEGEKIPYGISTNMNILKYVKPNFMKVTMDAGDPETYKELHGVDALNLVSNNLGKYVYWLEKEHIETKVGVQCITHSVEQVQAFYNAVRDLQVRYIQFRPVEMRGKNEKDYSAILNKIAELKRLDSTRVVALKYDLIDYRPKECYANWSVLTLNTHGDVIYCAHRPDEVIGSILNPKILEKVRAYKPDMNKCEVPCRLSAGNKCLDGFKYVGV
jgi:molybdenum cofactor biosynthesis enzyme MoaA